MILVLILAQPFGEDVRSVVFRLDVVEDDVLLADELPDFVVLDVHESGTLEVEVATLCNGNGRCVVAPDVGNPSVYFESLIKGVEPYGELASLEEGDVFGFHGGSGNDPLSF